MPITFFGEMNRRIRQAEQIVKTSGLVSQFGPVSYRVRSAVSRERYNVVADLGEFFSCDCIDYIKNKSVCRHIHAVMECIRKNSVYKNTPCIIREPHAVTCKFCGSGDIVRKGWRKNKTGRLQVYKCRGCKRRFAANFGFEGRRFDPGIITQALDLYFLNVSTRGIASFFQKRGINVSYRTIYNWIAQYSQLTARYTDGIVPRTRDRFTVRADEIFMNVGGERRYLFLSMEHDSRFWLAYDMACSKFLHDGKNLLRKTREQLGGFCPRWFETDRSPVYEKASRCEFGVHTEHYGWCHLQGERNNNMMERLNGEFRARERNFRGLKKTDSPIIPGMRVYYNYIRRHSGIGNMTPGEKAGIFVLGRDKWMTLIRNAAMNA